MWLEATHVRRRLVNDTDQMKRTDVLRVPTLATLLGLCVASSPVWAQSSASKAQETAVTKEADDVAKDESETNAPDSAPDDVAPDELASSAEKEKSNATSGPTEVAPSQETQSQKAPESKESESNVEGPNAAAATPALQNGAGIQVDPTPLRLDALPSMDALQTLRASDMNSARGTLRRVVRTAPDPERRLYALETLIENDMTVATVRICGRSLRQDEDPMVRRKSAECIGRAPEEFALEQVPTLVGALKDPNLDVVTMSGWALSNVGQPESLGVLASFATHPDHRVAQHFLTFSNHLMDRHGLSFVEATAETSYFEEDTSLRRVPLASNLNSGLNYLDLAGRLAWLGLFGGTAGWLHMGFLTAAYGGGFGAVAALGGMTGALTGGIAGITFGALGVDSLLEAHQVVQIATLGTLVGYGVGSLSTLPPIQGLNMASYGFLGGVAGLGLGIASLYTMPATASALTLGGAVGLGASLSFGSLALSLNFDPVTTMGIAMVSGGLTGGLTTLTAAPFEIGLLPSLGMTLGGISGALLMGTTVGIVESFQLAGNSDLPFTEGSGWAVASGYMIGGLVGAASSMLIPSSMDPFISTRLQLSPPQLGFIQKLDSPETVTPVAQIGGAF